MTWDEPLSSDMYRKWCELAADLNTATSCSIDRYMLKNSSSDIDETPKLHVFCDASMTSYGTAVYVYTPSTSALVMAKSRVAPLKTLTLPRLELMAAIIGSRLAKHVQKELQIDHVTLWSDSQIVLHWLPSTRTLPRFVKYHVTEIRTLLPEHKWRYCPTLDNPADLLTRGLSAAQFINNELWFKGPSWMMDIGSWPTWEPQSTTVCLTEACCDPITQSLSADYPHAVYGVHNLMHLTENSNLQRLLRVTAYVLRFVNNCRNRSRARPLSVTSSELFESEKQWISSCQRITYGEEIQCDTCQTTETVHRRQWIIALWWTHTQCSSCRDDEIPLPFTAEAPVHLFSGTRRARETSTFWSQRNYNIYSPEVLDSHHRTMCAAHAA